MGYLRHFRKCNGCQHFSTQPLGCILGCSIREDRDQSRAQVFHATDVNTCTAQRRSFAAAGLNIKMIAALGADNAIGYQQQLLFHIPSDLTHFKSTTQGGVLVMGRKTFESLPGVLPGREHWVLSSNPAISTHPQVRVFATLAELITHAKSALRGRILWVAGGGEIYRRFMPYANELVLTKVLATAAMADTFFPQIPHHFMEEERSTPHQGLTDAYPYEIVRFRTTDADAFEPAASA